MRKLIMLLFFLWFIGLPNVNAMSDCEYFVLPELGINHYQTCLQNPSNYSSYFIYYDVHFYDGSSHLKTSTVRKGEDAVPPSTPSKSGYTFTGWSKSITNIQSDKTVYALYEMNGYTITYKDYNGTTLKQEDVLPGGNGSPPSVSRTGYTFTGWSGSYTNVTSDRTLFAEYSVKTFTVRFFDYYNNLLKQQTVQYNYSATPPSPPTVMGMSFTGWSSSYTQIRASKDIKAVYEADTFTVTFRADDVLKVEEVAYGESATAPTVNKPGYRFIGWDTSFDDIRSDTTINALFEVERYLVQFVHEGVVLKQELVLYLGESTPPEFEKEGYDFLGWNGNYSNITSDVTLEPILSRKVFEVRYIDYDGTLFGVEEVFYGESAVGVEPVREGYTFTGYSISLDNVLSDLVVTLLYEATLLDVTFMYDSEILLRELVEYDGCVDAPVLDIEGYNITGWSDELCNIKTDLVIQPLLEAKEYTVTFKDYDGTTLSTQTVLYNQTAEQTPPERVGYDFLGWSDSVVIKNNITLIAEYKVKEFKVRFYIGEELIDSLTVPYNGTVIPPKIEKEGVKITGWSHPLTNIKKNVDIYAEVEQITFEIYYKDFDMTTLKVDEVVYGEDSIPPIVEREGYDFIGWSGDYKDIRSNNTLIAQYQPKLFTVRLFVDDALLDTLLVEYGKLPEFPDGYSFDSVYVFRDIDLLGTKDECFVDYYTDTFLGTYLCNEEVDAPIKEGYDFDSWETVDSGLKAVYRRQEFVVRFIYDGEVNEQRVGYGEDATPPLNDVNWDLSYKNITSNVDINGYIMPNDAPGLEVVDNAPYYELHFDEDISLFEISHFVIDGEIRSVQSVLFEADEIGRFDKKKNWVNITLEPGEVLEEVVLEKDYFYKYKIDEYRVDRSFLEEIIHWIKSIFS